MSSKYSKYLLDEKLEKNKEMRNQMLPHKDTAVHAELINQMSNFHPKEDDILDVLYRARKPITTNEIAERTGMAWATAKKYLEALEEDRYVASAKRGNSLYWWLVEK